MKEKIEDKLNEELNSLLDENLRNITSLNEKNSSIEEIESSISRDTKIDLDNLSKDLQYIKILKEEYDDLNVQKILFTIIEKSCGDAEKEIEILNILVIHLIIFRYQK